MTVKQHGKLEKSLGLGQRLPLYTGEETQNTFILRRLRTLDNELSGQERQTHRKRYFHKAPVVCQVHETVPKPAGIICDAFNQPVLSLQNASWTDGPPAPHGTARRPPASSPAAAQASQASG